MTARPEGPETAARVISLLRELTAATDRWVEVHGSRAGVHRTHLNALAHLMAAERAGRAMTAGELAEALPLSAPATTALVDRLVEAGHAVRSPHPRDRRRTVVSTTPLAHETGGRIFGPLGARMAGAMADFDEDELQVVARFLAAAARAADPGEASAPG